MARPACPRCQHGTFKLVEFEPQGSNYKYGAIVCSSCSTAIGVVDWYNVGTLAKSLEKKVDDLRSRTDSIGAAISTLANGISQILAKR